MVGSRRRVSGARRDRESRARDATRESEARDATRDASRYASRTSSDARTLGRRRAEGEETRTHRIQRGRKVAQGPRGGTASASFPRRLHRARQPRRQRDDSGSDAGQAFPKKTTTRRSPRPRWRICAIDPAGEGATARSFVHAEHGPGRCSLEEGAASSTACGLTASTGTGSDIGCASTRALVSTRRSRMRARPRQILGWRDEQPTAPSLAGVSRGADAVSQSEAAISSSARSNPKTPRRVVVDDPNLAQLSTRCARAEAHARARREGTCPCATRRRPDAARASACVACSIQT